MILGLLGLSSFAQAENVQYGDKFVIIHTMQSGREAEWPNREIGLRTWGYGFDGRANADFQQVSGSQGTAEGDLMQIKGPNGNENKSGIVKSGDIVQLYRPNANRYLYCDSARTSTNESTAKEVSFVTNQSEKTNWRVILEGKNTGDDWVNNAGQFVKFQHVESGAYLYIPARKVFDVRRGTNQPGRDRHYVIVARADKADDNESRWKIKELQKSPTPPGQDTPQIVTRQRQTPRTDPTVYAHNPSEDKNKINYDSTNWVIPASGNCRITFEVGKGQFDFYVALSTSSQQSQGENTDGYVLVFGGYGNQKSVIVKDGDPSNPIHEARGSLANPADKNKFWIDYHSDGRIRAGKGNPEEQDLIFDFTDPQPKQNVKYVGFGGWDQQINFSSITVSDIPSGGPVLLQTRSRAPRESHARTAQIQPATAALPEQGKGSMSIDVTRVTDGPASLEITISENIANNTPSGLMYKILVAHDGKITFEEAAMLVTKNVQNFYPAAAGDTGTYNVTIDGNKLTLGFGGQTVTHQFEASYPVQHIIARSTDSNNLTLGTSIQTAALPTTPADFTTPGEGGISFDAKRLREMSSIELRFSTEPEGQGDYYTVYIDDMEVYFAQETGEQYGGEQSYERGDFFPAAIDESAKYIVSIDGETISVNCNGRSLEHTFSITIPVTHVALSTDAVEASNVVKAATLAALPTPPLDPEAAVTFSQTEQDMKDLQDSMQTNLQTLSTRLDSLRKGFINTDTGKPVQGFGEFSDELQSVQKQIGEIKQSVHKLVASQADKVHVAELADNIEELDNQIDNMVVRVEARMQTADQELDAMQKKFSDSMPDLEPIKRKMKELKDRLGKINLSRPATPTT